MSQAAVPTAGAPAAPANAQQSGLWFIHQADPECAAYHIVFAAEATANPNSDPNSNPDLDLGIRVAGLLADLMREHDALRVAFRDGGQGPAQWVAESAEVDVRTTDARGLDRQTLRELVRTDTRSPFDLAEPPLWRVHLYRTAENSWVFAVVMHHAAFDFWTLALLLAEVRARLDGVTQRPTLDGTAFAAYAEQQAESRGSEKTAELLADAAGRLADAPPALDLYGDRPRPAVYGYNGASVPFTLTAATTEAVQRLARESSATPYMVLLTAYFITLSRLGGQEDILVGTPTSGRTQRRFRDALGNFVNTVVVRGAVDEALTGREQVAAVRDAALAAMRSQELPFPWLVRELKPPRDASRTPVYQAGFAWDRLPLLAEMGEFFVLEPGPDTALDVAGATLRPFPVPQQEGQTDLWIEMGAEVAGAYCGVLRYNNAVFAPGTAHRIADAFAATATALVATPDSAVRTLDRADGSVRDQLAQWGHGPVRDLPEATLPELFRARAERTPEAVALVADGESWSYSKLLGEAEKIADALRGAGVGAGDRVAVMLERGAPLVAALLGVMEAGAAYVPLDPKLPVDRLTYMADDSGARLLLSQLGLRDEWLPGLPVLAVDDLGVGVQGTQGAVTGGDGADSDDDGGFTAAEKATLAYVLYTSGSTGRPKGVAIPHRALANLLLAMLDETGFTAADSLLAVTTVSFDIAGLELFMPLLGGGSVVVCDSDTAADGTALAAFVEESGATWMQATPTSWRMLRDAGWQGSGRLNILCGGEELPPELAGFLTANSGGVRNVYGPTETTIWSTCGPVEPARGVDIGRPLWNTRLYVLDPFGREVEPGFPGELWIGGEGLAAGYWARPELTAERFGTGLPAAPEQRLYRTGDRARWTADGRLLHLGRLDHQVKLRGFRIELGEVETVLRAVDGVTEAVVVVRDDRLVGYLVAAPGATLDPEGIRAAAARSLPQYMVPSILMVLDELPLTANKKIDRNRLPAPVAASSAPFEKPRDATEITLARIWEEILGLDEIGIHDDFFDMGGHSLLAVRLSSAVQAEWGVKVPISLLLRHSTIAKLATVVRAGGSSDAPRTPVLQLREGADGTRPMFLFHPFGGTVFCYLELTRHLSADQSVFAIEAPGIESEGETEVSVEDMAARYTEWIREIQPAGPYSLGGWCFGGVIAFEAAALLRAAGEEIELLAAIDSRAPVEANIPDTADDATLLSWFARDLAVPYGKTLDLPADLLRDLGDGAFDHILDQAAAIGVVAEDADRAQMLRYFEAYLANGIALQTYLPEPKDLDLLLLRARDEPAAYGPYLGWDRLIGGDLRTVEVPGDHNSVMYPPHAAVAAQAIAEHLGARQS